MSNILDKMKNTRLLAMIGFITMFLGVIMPLVEYNLFGYKISGSLWQHWQGKVIMILVILNLVFVFNDKVEQMIPALFNNEFGKKVKSLNNPKYSLVLTIIATVLALSVTLNLKIELKYYGIGFYSLWIGIICLVAYAILHKNRQEF